MTTASNHCLDLVRSADRDRFLANLYAPPEKRRWLLALHAFDIEMRRIGAIVSEPRLGEIRYQWWRETLEGLSPGSAPEHPIAQELAGAIAACKLPMAPLIGLIEARSNRLFAQGPPDLVALERYLGETRSILIQLSAMILIGPEASATAEAAGLAGVAQGIGEILRRGEAEVLKFASAGFDAHMLAAHGAARLAQARRLLPGIPVAALPAFLSAGVSELYFNRVLSGGDAKAGIAISPLHRQFKLWRLARRGEF